MWPFAQIANGVRSLWTPKDEVRPELARPVGQLQPGTITSTSVSAIRTTIAAHEEGNFAESALLAKYLLRDADIKSALNQRVDGLLGLPLEIEPAKGRWGPPCHRTVQDRWVRICARQALSDVIRDAVMLGLGVAQIVWDYEAGTYTPRLEPWNLASVYLDGAGNLWAQTVSGPVLITPGYGWLVYSPFSTNAPQFYGALTAVAPWVLRSDYSARDASRWSEVHGQGTWLAKVPSGTRNQATHAEFLNSIRAIGRAAVVPLPQGQTPEQSYSLELAEAKSDGWQGFEFLLNRAGRAIRLSILGQDLTSISGPAGGSYAQSKVGDGVRQDVKASDARSLAECLYTQLLRPYATYLHGAPEAAPTVCWDASEPEDLSALATSWETLGRAFALLKQAGINVDLVAASQRFGVPVDELEPLLDLVDSTMNSPEPQPTQDQAT